MKLFPKSWRAACSNSNDSSCEAKGFLSINVFLELHTFPVHVTNDSSEAGNHMISFCWWRQSVNFVPASCYAVGDGIVTQVSEIPAAFFLCAPWHSCCSPKSHMFIWKSTNWHQHSLSTLCYLIRPRYLLQVIAGISKMGWVLHYMVLLMCISVALWILRGISFLIMFQSFGNVLLT